MKPAQVTIMTQVPFVLRGAQSSPARKQIFLRDVPTSEDPIPAPVAIHPTGYALERETRVTLVARETLDDR